MQTISLDGQPLDLDTTLSCGQAFRWRRREDGLWQGVIGDRFVELGVKGDTLSYRTFPDGGDELVRDYLRLSDDVKYIYAYLQNRDRRLAAQIQRFYGLRLLRQPPNETLISFMCSAANNISRISNSIEALARHYGKLICERDGVCYYAFPSCERLAEADDISRLCSLGFRGENIKNAARAILERGEDWLIDLRGQPYDEAREQLMSLNGVGAKIADCVCLFALDKDEAAPVDTHVRQLAQRLFLPGLNTKSMTDGVYRAIVKAFRDRYDGLAGWAQQFLYYEDLLRP
ncbi:MAG: 8-oxoguanine DNA glycosylase [Armatimonadetes bacterium]|jgi:N-glycosylase/DNA lyase|nr:8-oxoguanine DNA glycosylase [Armatimonadota bacterium]